MTVEVRLPQWGMGMLEGTIIQWYKSPGDEVTKDEPLAEVEAAKTTEELRAPAGGILTSVLVEAGRLVPVHELLALIGEPGDDVTRLAPPPAPGDVPVRADAGVPVPGEAAEPQGRGGVRVVPLARRRAKELGLDLAEVSGSGPQGRITLDDVEAAHAAASASPGPVRNVVPKARQLARELGVDLDEVAGSGPQGRILVADVEAAAATTKGTRCATGPEAVATSPAPAVAEPGPAPWAAPAGTPISAMRRVIGRRMTESLQTTAQLTLFRRMDVTAVTMFRRSITRATPPSFVDIFIRASALALRRHPGVNAYLDGDRLVLRDSVDVGFAVAVDDGLLVPVIRNADRLALAEVSVAARDLAGRCREQRVEASDLEGGGFSISSLGGQGIDAFTPILNPPEAAILGIGRTSERAVRYGEGLGWRTELTASLTIDHRIVDGAPGAAFLATVAELVSDPEQLLG